MSGTGMATAALLVAAFGGGIAVAAALHGHGLLAALLVLAVTATAFTVGFIAGARMAAKA